MNRSEGTHPPAEQLRAFARGQVSSDELTDIETHLRSCSTCCDVLGSLPDDELVTRIRTAGRSSHPDVAGASPSDDADSRPAPSGDRPRVDGYEILTELGRGGMGVVYKARQLGLDRFVALKVLVAASHADVTRRARFRAEAEAIARLRHPNVVQVHDTGFSHGLPYFALEYVEDGTLAAHVRATPQPVAAAAAFTALVAGAVAAAHAEGIVHRDLKPANILLVRKPGADPAAGLAGFDPKIADFGLAKWAEQGDGLTQSGTLVGTPAYMAPEQAGRHGAVGPAADVYALGVILYELLTGRPPFQGSTLMDVLDQVRHAEPISPRRLVPRLPRDLETICLKCLEKEPGRRYPSADALADDLRHFGSGEPIAARPIGALGRTWKWGKRRPAVASLIALVALVATTGFVGVVTQWQAAIKNERTADRMREDAVRERDNADQMRGEAERARDDSRRSLHQSLFREAQAIRLARQPGYRARVWNLLRQATDLGIPGIDPGAIRHEAAACLGDFLGHEPLEMHDFSAEVYSFAFDPRGLQLAVGLGDGAVSIRSLATGQETARLTIPEGASKPPRVAFVDGGNLAVAHPAGEVQTWTRSGDDTWHLADTFALGHAAPALAMTADGKYIAGGQDQSVTLWNRETRKIVRQFTAPAGVSQVNVSPEGKWLAAAYTAPASRKGTEGTPMVQVWEVATGEALTPFPPEMHYIRGLSFSADEDMLACACLEGAAVYRLPDLERIDSVRGVMARSTAFSPDGRLLAVPSLQEDVVRLWPVATGLERTTLPHPGLPRRVAFSPDGRLVVTATERSIRVWDRAGTPEKRVLSGHRGGVPCVAFSPDGKTLASVSKDRTLRLWNLLTGEPRPMSIRFSGEGQAVAFSPDGRFIGTADYTAGKAQIWNLASGREVASVSEGVASRVQSVAFSPDGRFFAAGSVLGLRIFHVDRTLDSEAPFTLRPYETGPKETSTVGHLCFSPDGKVLAWANDHQGIVHSWDLEAGRVLLTGVGPVANRIQSLAFFPDGRRIIFLNRHLVAEVWDVRNHRRTAAFAAVGPRKGEVVSYAQHISLSQDGRWLAASTVSGRGVNLWEVETGRLLVTLPEETGVVWCLAWSPDGRHLAVSRSNGGLAVWNCTSVRQQLAELGVGW